MNALAPDTGSVINNLFERLGHRLTWLAFTLVTLIYIAAPLLALSWLNIPFPGFLVEQTLVVNQSRGEGWSGLQAGVEAGQHILRIGGIPVTTPSDYKAALRSFEVGEQVAVFSVGRDGTEKLTPDVTLGRLPGNDFIRLFWLPYLVGLAYFGIGVWIYRARGRTRSGLALTIFCLLTATVCALIFDISATLVGTTIWIAAISMTGAALISMAMCFPYEWVILRKRLWVLAAPYLISIVLLLWNLLVLNDTSRPWAYYEAWGASYRFLALAILFFMCVLIFYAQKKSSSPVVRRQARIVLLGSVLAFLPILTWFIAPVLKIPMAFNVSLFLPPLILFPLSISIAILRYRLLEIDALVHRTIVYGLLTAILAGLFTALVGLSQRLFITLTGERSDVAIVITTLIVGSAFAPIRARLQAFVDRYFKDLPDRTKTLQDFGEQVRSFVQMSSAHQLTLRLLNESASALHAESGAFALVNGSRTQPRTLHTYRNWKGEALINLSVEYDGHRYGFLMLGPRLDGQPYTQREYQLLKQVSSHIAAAIQLSPFEYPESSSPGDVPQPQTGPPSA